MKKEESLPTQYELTKLAAILTTGHKTFYRQHQAVEEALQMWRGAGEILESVSPILNKEEQKARDEVGHYCKALVIGNHYLPPISDDFFQGADKVELNSFLEVVVGLTSHDDRMKWFRSYINSRNGAEWNTLVYDENKEIADDVAYYKKHGFNRVRVRMPQPKIEHLPMPEGLTEKERRQVNLDQAIAQIKIDFSTTSDVPRVSRHAFLYREWRLTMRTNEVKATKPYDLEECLLAGKKKFEELEKKRLES